MSQINLKENRQKWVEALRSGRFPQGKNYLNSNEGLCCLGVLCEVAMENGVDLKKEDTVALVTYDNMCAFPPGKAMDWVGLKNSAGDYTVNSLAKLNDAGRKFDHIANVIASEPEGLFKD